MRIHLIVKHGIVMSVEKQIHRCVMNKPPTRADQKYKIKKLNNFPVLLKLKNSAPFIFF